MTVAQARKPTAAVAAPHRVTWQQPPKVDCSIQHWLREFAAKNFHTAFN
jgi:hypothetical protein